MFELALMGIVPVGNFYGPELLRPAFVEIDADERVESAVIGGPNVAPNFQVDLEAIAALRPDMVLTSDDFVPYFGDALPRINETIAPVVVVPARETWQERTRAVARAVDVPLAAEDRIARIERLLANLAADLDAAGQRGTVVSAVRRGPGTGEIYAFVPPSQTSTTLGRLGLTQPEAQSDRAAAMPGFPPVASQFRVSEERLVEHDGDEILFGEVAPGDVEAFVGQPVARTLSAVRTGDVAGVSYFVWALPTAVGVQEILDDVREHVLRR